MSTTFDIIAFDADDTLWHNEGQYRRIQERFKDILAPYCDPQQIAQEVYRAETRNLSYYGYGIKSFALSLIELALELSRGRIPASAIQELISLVKDMLNAEVQVLPGTAEVLTELGRFCPLMLITKGDTFEQDAKITRSGLRDYFRYIEIVADKTQQTYAAIMSKYGFDPKRFLMIGNSLRSDVLPVVALGGRAIYIPYPLTWDHENQLPVDINSSSYIELEHLGLLPACVENLNRIDTMS